MVNDIDDQTCDKRLSEVLLKSLSGELTLVDGYKGSSHLNLQ